MHPGMKSYKCTKYEKTFAKKNVLKNHFDIVHEEKKPWVCDVCGYGAFVKGKLKKHIDKVNRVAESLHLYHKIKTLY